MTTLAVTAPIAAPRIRFDLSTPVLLLFAAVLCVLIVMPLSWLVYYAFTDKSGAFTLANFQRLVVDAAYLDPLLTTFELATLSAIICCVVAAPMGWLVARTDMPLRRTVRLLVTASFVTPPFLGAIAWELLAAPNSGLLNQLFRDLTGAAADAHLLNIYRSPGWSLSSAATPSLMSSCWSPMRSTACPAISRTLPPSSAAAPGIPRGASPFPWRCRRCSPAPWSPSCRR